MDPEVGSKSTYAGGSGWATPRSLPQEERKRRGGYGKGIGEEINVRGMLLVCYAALFFCFFPSRRRRTESCEPKSAPRHSFLERAVVSSVRVGGELLKFKLKKKKT